MGGRRGSPPFSNSSEREPSFASLCVQCGECVDKCPQHIDIPAVLESVVIELEGPDLEQRVAMAKQVFKQM